MPILGGVPRVPVSVSVSYDAQGDASFFKTMGPLVQKIAPVQVLRSPSKNRYFDIPEMVNVYSLQFANWKDPAF